MAEIRPFRALRPTAELASKIAALPYDVMNSQEAKEMVQNDPYSFLRIDRGEINFSEPTDPHDPKVYRKAAEIFEKMVAQNQFIQDLQANFYIYRQIMEGRAQTGLVATTSLDDYQNEIIKKHEFTRPEKEEDRIRHIKALQAQSGPIFQTYRAEPKITEIINHWTEQHKPLYEFTAFAVEQIVWVIDEAAVIDQLVALFAEIDYLYIADGHHRSQAAVRVGLELREKDPHYLKEAPFNYFLSVLFPASDLKIWPYNRVVRDLNKHSEEEFLQAVQKSFDLKKAPQSPYQPKQKHTFGMYLNKQWYKLCAKAELQNIKDPVKSLDAALLQDHLLEPILNIKDPRTEQRLDFVGGIRGLKELERRTETDMKVAFALYPTSIQEVIKVADSGQVMPPKSTWFEPKLLSGLFIHKLT